MQSASGGAAGDGEDLQVARCLPNPFPKAHRCRPAHFHEERRCPEADPTRPPPTHLMGKEMNSEYCLIRSSSFFWSARSVASSLRCRVTRVPRCRGSPSSSLICRGGTMLSLCIFDLTLWDHCQLLQAAGTHCSCSGQETRCCSAELCSMMGRQHTWGDSGSSGLHQGVALWLHGRQQRCTSLLCCQSAMPVTPAHHPDNRPCKKVWGKPVRQVQYRETPP